jgi:hypothetical protein
LLLQRSQLSTEERAAQLFSHLARSFFDAQAFAAQYGTEEARNYVLEGLKKAGFR